MIPLSYPISIRYKCIAELIQKLFYTPATGTKIDEILFKCNFIIFKLSKRFSDRIVICYVFKHTLKVTTLKSNYWNTYGNSLNIRTRVICPESTGHNALQNIVPNFMQEIPAECIM